MQLELAALFAVFVLQGSALLLGSVMATMDNVHKLAKTFEGGL